MDKDAKIEKNNDNFTKDGEPKKIIIAPKCAKSRLIEVIFFTLFKTGIFPLRFHVKNRKYLFSKLLLFFQRNLSPCLLPSGRNVSISDSGNCCHPNLH